MHGERVLDTYIKLYNEAPSTRKGQSMVIKQWASTRAPNIDIVRKVVLFLIKGRRLVGYHVIQKLREFKILDEFLAENEDNSSTDLLTDCCSMFDPEKKQQIPIETLCERFLSLKFKKQKNQPHAFTEAKIGMALFRRW